MFPPKPAAPGGPPQAPPRPMPPQAAPGPGGPPGGAPGAPQQGNAVDPNNPVQAMLLDRCSKLPEPAYRALQNASPEVLAAIKLIVPEIAVVLDGLATGAGQAPIAQPPMAQQDATEPDQDDGEGGPPARAPYARPATRLGAV